MKITKLTLYPVPPRWMFLKIETDEGVSGWGEPVVEGKADTVAACVREMEPYLLGRDPRRIEDLWQVLYRGAFYRGGPVISSAISGVNKPCGTSRASTAGCPYMNSSAAPAARRSASTPGSAATGRTTWDAPRWRRRSAVFAR